jgi:hypothetical protein
MQGRFALHFALEVLTNPIDLSIVVEEHHFSTEENRRREHEKTLVSRVGLAVLSHFMARRHAGCAYCGLLHPGISRGRPSLPLRQ